MPRLKPKPTPNAVHQRAYRARAKRGLVILPLPVRRETIDRLAASGLTTAEDRARLFEVAAWDRLKRFR